METTTNALIENKIITQEPHIDQETLKYIEYFRHIYNLPKSKMNILDWGCGTGRAVAFLMEQGYSAYGVDIDPNRIENGKLWFDKRGLCANNILTLLRNDGKSRFPDNFFHFVFSNQVLEHVRDIGEVASEISRITRLNGMGFHVYPAHRGLIEEHLFMPCVHWFPKTGLCNLFILIWVLLGVEPKWKDLDGKNSLEKSRVYFNYLKDFTYYRDYKTVQKAFQQNGIRVEFVSVNHYKVKNISNLLFKSAKIKIFRNMINLALINFKAVCLLTTKT